MIQLITHQRYRFLVVIMPGLLVILLIPALLRVQISWAVNPNPSTSTRGITLTPEEIQANRILEKKMQLLKELRTRRDRCVAEFKARNIIIEKATKSEIDPLHPRIKSLKEKEAVLLRKLPVNTSSGTYQIVNAKLAEIRKELDFLIKREKELISYWQAKQDEMAQFYYKGADLDDASRWILEKASLQQIAQFNINDPKYDVNSLFRKYPKRE